MSGDMNVVCLCGKKHRYNVDCEDAPRNAAAIRTAILLGAVFIQNDNGYWHVEGIGAGSAYKTTPAFLFLVTHGIVIDRDAKPVMVKDMLPTSGEPESYRKLALIMQRFYR